jgi:hypothetical protein
MRTRRGQATLSDSEWDRFIDAMKCLKQSNTTRNWDYFVELHAKYGHSFGHDQSGLPERPDGNGHLHVHDPTYWLVWHRQFVLEFENRLREFDPSIKIPYWRWTVYREIPEKLKKKFPRLDEGVKSPDPQWGQASLR